MSRLAIIEDNEDFRIELVYHLRRAGFSIAFESDGRDIDRLLEQHDVDLVVLDLGLPAEDGLSIAARIRQRYAGVGIVMVTARGDINERILGLEHGADAYLVKPVDMRELTATLTSVQRRVAELKTSQQPAWLLDVDNLLITSPEGKSIALTLSETLLLRALAEALPGPASKEQLAELLGYQNIALDSRKLEVAISRLRSKLNLSGTDSLIRSVRHVGYRFAAEMRMIN